MIDIQVKTDISYINVKSITRCCPKYTIKSHDLIMNYHVWWNLNIRTNIFSDSNTNGLSMPIFVLLHLSYQQ